MKKRDVITLTEGPLTLTIPAHAITQVFTAVALAHVSNLQQAPANESGIPALGEYWPGEGGHNAGLIRGVAGAPDYYLIVPAGTAAEFKAEWGGYGRSVAGATSASDGLTNTNALLEDADDHPAAKLAAGYTADGHEDFYLPARRELQLCEANVPELFTKGYHWSSSQSSALLAFGMDFEDGWQYDGGKGNERLVRPVRRKYL
ncbi:hypothetical protein [Pseudomonas sp. ML96]|uniref:hypothetical protein n=1 Tax=Pseudomonas sp. ML96 TaxID=1523503 RepID=UPI0005BCAB5A|nr:hypothetical protein [Pseudomonas sp. ML96]